MKKAQIVTVQSIAFILFSPFSSTLRIFQVRCVSLKKNEILTIKNLAF
jgi:hypothetical protein